MVGVMVDSGRFPGAMKFALLGGNPNALLRSAELKSSISSFMMIPGVVRIPDPKNKFTVDVMALSKPHQKKKKKNQTTPFFVFYMASPLESTTETCVVPALRDGAEMLPRSA
jgi:hypothetical protein